VEGYRIEAQEEAQVSQGSEAFTSIFNSDECRAELTGLRPGVAYRVRVTARSKAGPSERSAPAVLRTEGGVPPPSRLHAAIAADGLEPREALCSWEFPAGDGVTFLAEVDHGGEGSADFRPAYSGAAPHFALSLRPGTAYKFRVRAETPAGTSPWSLVKGIARPGGGAAGVSLPESPAVRLGEGGAASFSWAPPAGAAASAYQVRIDLQEGKKLPAQGLQGLQGPSEERMEVVRADLVEGPHRFQVRPPPLPPFPVLTGQVLSLPSY